MIPLKKKKKKKALWHGLGPLVVGISLALPKKNIKAQGQFQSFGKTISFFFLLFCYFLLHSNSTVKCQHNSNKNKKKGVNTTHFLWTSTHSTDTHTESVSGTIWQRLHRTKEHRTSYYGGVDRRGSPRREFRSAFLPKNAFNCSGRFPHPSAWSRRWWR